MDGSRPDTPYVPRLEHDVRDLEDPLRQLAVLVQAEDVHQRRKHGRTEGREILVQRVPDYDAVWRVEPVLRRGDRERHHLLVSVAHEQDAQGLREVVRLERLADRLEVREAPGIPIVSRGDRQVFDEVHLVQDVEPIRRREDRDRVSVRARVVPHPPKEVDRLTGFQGETEEFARAVQVYRMRSGRQVRRLERSVCVLRPDGLDPSSALRKRGRQNREAAAHRLEVGPGDVDEQVPSIRRELRQDPVDHGREAQHLAARIRDDGEDRLRRDEVRVLAALLVLRQDVQEIHFLRHAERREAEVARVDRLAGERRRDLVHVVEPDRHLLASPADRQVELFLEVEERPQQGVLELETADDAADRVRAHVGHAPIHDEVDSGRLGSVHRQPDLHPEEPAKPAGDPFDRIEVRPVREHVEGHDVALDALRARAHERDPVDELLDGQRLADEVHEILVPDVDVRQGGLRCILAIYTVSRDGKGKGRTVACRARIARRNLMETQKTIGIAGVGKMGEALVRGLIVGRVVPPSRILVSDAIPARAREIAAKHGVAALETVADLARNSDILVLAAKPKDMPSLVTGIGVHVKRDALIITLAAGVRTAFVEKALAGRGRVVRIMPNLACALGEGATAFALGRSATEHDALVVEEVFGALGRVTMVDEPMLDAVTGLSGSGRGFIAALAHSMIEGGVRSGLPRDVAYKLALQTMKGTAELLLIDGLEPMQLFRMVATPNGTTEAGWAVMEKRGVPPAISDAIVAASKRAADLAAEGATAPGEGAPRRSVMRPRKREGRWPGPGSRGRRGLCADLPGHGPGRRRP